MHFLIFRQPNNTTIVVSWLAWFSSSVKNCDQWLEVTLTMKRQIILVPE
jgi:hypothetical protein